eukprot:TRINITY_DN13853_c0_g1_i1.p1 TRINITY_DN13853_c0_g1~~TRINITY_DN13853_c0_g1_i1.p1  ORF type:complete len:344 (+),score=45.49 TRINITY_DN13853_c0_g1_i1:45-1076(+)
MYSELFFTFVTFYLIAVLTVNGQEEGVPPTECAPSARVYALGDVHGDFRYTLANLYAIGLIDEQGSWSGGNSILIQMGDIFDRGDDGRLICDYFYDLRADARAKGGQVLNLLGNHETMNFAGWLNYVSRGDYKQFGGAAARKKHFEADGFYGQYLRDFRTIIGMNNTVFIHAGLLPEWASYGIEAIEAEAQEAIQAGQWDAPVLSTTGPMWTRDLVYAAQDGDCELVHSSLAALSVAEAVLYQRMVVGHTPQDQAQVQFYCDGALVATDIAISRAMGGGLIGALLLEEVELEGERQVVAKAVPEEPFQEIEKMKNLEKNLLAHYKELWASGRGLEGPPSHDEL